MRLRTLIVEDEQPAANRLIQLLEESEHQFTIESVLDSVEETVSWFQKNPNPELVFMDIQLSDDLSFSIFNEVEIKCPIIFTTAFDEYALQAFRVNSIDYLLKPIDKKDLARALSKLENISMQNLIPGELGKILLNQVSQAQRSYRSRFLVKKGEQFLSVSVDEVRHITSENKITFIHTEDNKKYFVDHILEELENSLAPEHFFRLNRQCITALESIESIHSYFNGKLKVYLKGNVEPFVVSREKASQFKQWLNQ